MRFALDANDVLPISFEWIFTGAVPPRARAPRAPPQPRRLRLDADIVRYHQIGTARAGSRSTATRNEFDDDDTRCRPATTRGACATWSARRSTTSRTRPAAERVDDRDLVADPVRAPRRHPLRAAPLLPAPRLRRLAAHRAAGWHRAPRRPPRAVRRARARARGRDDNRRLRGAELDCTMADGSRGRSTVTALGDTGFHLGAGLYFGFDGHWHGEWRGDLHVDGEHIADCTDPRRRGASTRSATPSCASTTLSAAAPAAATCRPSSPAPHPDLGLTEDVVHVRLAIERDLDDLRAGLERWLGRPVGAIERPRPGFSCETLLVDRELVVRLPPLGDGIFPTYDLAQQAAVQDAVGGRRRARRRPARYEPDPSFLGAPFMAMPFVAGPIPGPFTPADPWLTGLPDDAARRGVGVVPRRARRHPRGRPDGLGLRPGLDDELAFWAGYLGWATDGSPPPALADTLVAWCRANRPAGEPPTACCGATSGSATSCSTRERRPRGPCSTGTWPSFGPGRDGPGLVPRRSRRCRPTSRAWWFPASAPGTRPSPSSSTGSAGRLSTWTGTRSSRSSGPARLDADRAPVRASRPAVDVHRRQ